jgi:release factor glutamine methyltransferase
MTAAVTDSSGRIVAADGVYAPQHDSWLLIDTLTKPAVSAGRHLLDLCTGSGVVGIAPASRVRPASPRPTSVPKLCSAPAPLVGVDVDLRLGRVTSRVERRAVDVVVCNPPYTPVGRHAGIEVIPTAAGSRRR